MSKLVKVDISSYWVVLILWYIITETPSRKLKQIPPTDNQKSDVNNESETIPSANSMETESLDPQKDTATNKRKFQFPPIRVSLYLDLQLT
jgi:hypothetical protein